MGLIASLRRYLTPVDTRIAPLQEAVADLQRRLASLEETEATAVEREIKWAEMNAQLRRYLGRLDAHAGRQREDDDAPPARNGARADVIAAKFPHGLPTKE